MPESNVASGEITIETVEHLAGLARISLTPDELEKFTSELGSILNHIAKVGEVAGSEVPITSHPIALTNVTREDEIADVLSREQALQNAPEQAAGMFRVSSILGEEQ